MVAVYARRAPSAYDGLTMSDDPPAPDGSETAYSKYVLETVCLIADRMIADARLEAKAGRAKFPDKEELDCGLGIHAAIAALAYWLSMVNLKVSIDETVEKAAAEIRQQLVLLLERQRTKLI
jgi:hypothetical protein